MTRQAEKAFDDLVAAMGSLVDDYLRDACPCRFPRFRAIAGLDTSRAVGGSFTTREKGLLIAAYEEKVPLVDKAAYGPYSSVVPGFWQAKCGRCKSEVHRSSNEFASGGFIDYLTFEPAPGVVDVGAPVSDGKVLRVSPFESPGPSMQGSGEAAALHPIVALDEFLRWMRERAPAPATPPTR